MQDLRRTNGDKTPTDSRHSRVRCVGADVSAEPLSPPAAAALTNRLLDGKVWLVHAVIVRVIDGDTVVANMNLGWHTWRHNEPVRLNVVDAPERKNRARWAEATALVERLLPFGTDIPLVAEKL